MTIYNELHETEQRVAELRAKVAQVQQLEKQKQELLESENTHKGLCEKLVINLEEKKQETVESLTARNLLVTRIQRLQAEQLAYNQRINQEVAELNTEAATLVNQAGEALYTAFVNHWNITNPISSPVATNTSVFSNYSVDAITEQNRRDRKLKGDWAKYWQGVVSTNGN